MAKPKAVESSLDRLRRAVFGYLADGSIRPSDLRVVDEQGMTPIVVALETETVGDFAKRVATTGGYANAFFGMSDGRIVSGYFLPPTEAIRESDAEEFGDSPIHASSSIGMFVGWALGHDEGVKFAVRLPQSQDASSSPTNVQGVRQLDVVAP